MLTVVFVLMLIATLLLGFAGQVWKGRYQGNSDVIRSSAQFWFLIVAAVTVILGIARFA
jgi:hypothetical protein